MRSVAAFAVLQALLLAAPGTVFSPTTALCVLCLSAAAGVKLVKDIRGALGDGGLGLGADAGRIPEHFDFDGRIETSRALGLNLQLHRSRLHQRHTRFDDA